MKRAWEKSDVSCSCSLLDGGPPVQTNMDTQILAEKRDTRANLDIA